MFISDMQRIIRLGPSSLLIELRLPTVLKCAEINDILQNDKIEEHLVDYFYDTLYDKVRGQGQIEFSVRIK